MLAQKTAKIYLSNQDIAKLLTPQDCIDALDDAIHALARGAGVSHPRTDIWVPCGRDDGYYRWGSKDSPLVSIVVRMSK